MSCCMLCVYWSASGRHVPCVSAGVLRHREMRPPVKINGTALHSQKSHKDPFEYAYAGLFHFNRGCHVSMTLLIMQGFYLNRGYHDPVIWGAWCMRATICHHLLSSSPCISTCHKVLSVYLQLDAYSRGWRSCPVEPSHCHLRCLYWSPAGRGGMWWRRGA